jgi:hypothetical protein
MLIFIYNYYSKRGRTWSDHQQQQQQQQQYQHLLRRDKERRGGLTPNYFSIRAKPHHQK